MDEQIFKKAVFVTRQAFMSQQRPQWRETPVESRVNAYYALPRDGRDEFLHGLIVESPDTKLAWDSVNLIAENLLRGEESLPAELRKWIADVQSDQRKRRNEKRRPRPSKGGSRHANRDWVICGAIQYVGTLYDLPPTRNGAGPEECCAEGGSACDVVGQAAFGETAKAYKNVERIWEKRDPLLSYKIPKKV